MMVVISIVFYIFAALIVASALAVVLLKNLVHAALYLIVAFVGVAAMYVLLQAEFLAVVQILVYAGAVAIIIAFGLMLTRRTNMEETSAFNLQKGRAAFIGAGIFGMIAFLFSKTEWKVQEGAEAVSVTEGISEFMFVDYVIAFETIAILLLIAMVGAIVIAKEVKKRDDNA
jgi:NADH:ubiquinone oxidoreductase subunit 6 (subunit J)